MEFDSWSKYMAEKPFVERLKEFYYASERRMRNEMDACRPGIGQENKRYYDSEENAQGQRADFLYQNLCQEYELLNAIVYWEEFYMENPNEKDDAWIDFLYKLHKNNLHLECAYGCSSYGYVCDGNPYMNPCCPSSTIINKEGEEICLDNIK